LASLVAVTDIYFNPEREAGRTIALDVDIAVIVPGVRDDHAVMVADPYRHHGSVTGGLWLDPDRHLERFGPVLGVGDAIWRALSIVSAEIVCVVSDWPAEPAQIECLTQPLIDDPG